MFVAVVSVFVAIRSVETQIRSEETQNRILAANSWPFSSSRSTSTLVHKTI